MKSIAITVATVFGLIGSVAAHGGVGKYSWGGREYQGWSPYNGGSQQTFQRPWPSYDPIMTPTGTNIRCNNNGQTSQYHETIAAGTAITAHWAQWTHAEGPVTVYMARCPGSCANFDGSGQVWFKIDEAGLLSGTLAKGEWGNGVVLKTLKWTSTIPASLAPGNYLIRHEVLALHQANTPQFYPECAQLTVTGSGTASPSGSYLVSLPGAFTMSDPGVMVDIYSSAAQSITTYKVPGPPVWPGNGGGSNPNPNPQPQPTTTPPPTQPPRTTSTTIRTTSTPVTPPPSTGGGSVAKYGQCGGIGYSGPTSCASGSTCTVSNPYYSQCL